MINRKKAEIKKLSLLITLATVCICLICLGGCSQWQDPYSSLEKDGYNVTVKYDSNGGIFASMEGLTVVDVFSPENAEDGEGGTKKISLIAPDSPLRGDKKMSISREGYSFAGWFTTRSARVDDSGNPLDEYGVLTSISGREQGYTYSGKWDFEKDYFSYDPSKKPSSENDLVLYAGWIPHFAYEFYVKGENGEYSLYSTISSVSLSIPEWNSESGKLDMLGFPSIENKTLDGAFADPELTEKLEGTVVGEIDTEHGVCLTPPIKIYTTWLDGVWFHIHSVEQLQKNARLDGSYVLSDDLDFSNSIWPAVFTSKAFSGRIYGNGHKISNVSVIQADISQLEGGLFGSIASSAEIKDLTFENISYTLDKGSRLQGASFGALAGKITEDAIFENVSVSGKLLISPRCYPSKSYSIGALCGNCNNFGVDISRIEVALSEEGALSLDYDVETGAVTLAFSN